jgi:hypothetical protein
MAGAALAYAIAGGEIEDLGANARKGIDVSQNLRNALWLNGRANRTAADFYMIHEYAEMEYKGVKGIATTMGLSVNSQSRLTRSANNLSPLAGGRHATGSVDALLTLDQQADWTADLLRRWIAQFA